MRITIRIYKRHDPDLLALWCACPDKTAIKQWIKDILRGYINNAPVNMLLPDYESDPMAALPAKANFHINLDKDKDADLIEFIGKIKIGRRNNLIKQIIRNSFPVILSPYYTESEYQSFEINDIKKEGEPENV